MDWCIDAWEWIELDEGEGEGGGGSVFYIALIIQCDEDIWIIYQTW